MLWGHEFQSPLLYPALVTWLFGYRLKQQITDPWWIMTIKWFEAAKIAVYGLLSISWIWLARRMAVVLTFQAVLTLAPVAAMMYDFVYARNKERKLRRASPNLTYIMAPSCNRDADTSL